MRTKDKTKRELITLADEINRKANLFAGLDPHTSPDKTEPDYFPRDRPAADALRDVAKELRRIIDGMADGTADEAEA